MNYGLNDMLRGAEHLRYEDCFSLSRDYRGCGMDIGFKSGLVRENSGRPRSFGHSERHLQAVWYDSLWRPDVLYTSSGETVRVEYPGRWNLEAGPDFIGATIVVGPDERRITGDVEVHINPADWKHHGHHDDKRYRNVCLHIAYYEGILPDDLLPPGALQVSLRPLLQRDPSFSFEHIDVSMYPYAGRADLPPCRLELAGWSIDDKASLLDAAGHERLRLKAVRFASAIDEQGADQAFYRAFFSALGFQHNRQPFHALAGLMPLDRLRELAGGNDQRAYAILAGLSGLLPQSVDSRWDEETRGYVRSLWDIWWKEKGRFPRSLKRSDWRLRGIRPLNHPLRRLVSAAHIFSRPFDAVAVINGWAVDTAFDLMSGLRAFMEPQEDGYWPHRVSLGGTRRKNRTAILGKSRLEAVALNVVIPMAAAMNSLPEQVSSMLSGAGPEPFNQPMRQAAFYLFGPDAPSALYGSAVRRQGLMQIFQDYCMQDRSRCSRCSFPSKLAKLDRITS